MKSVFVNNLSGLSNPFFAVTDPGKICRENEKNYQNIMYSIQTLNDLETKPQAPFIILGDFFQVSSLGDCFVDQNGQTKQRRVFYTSSLFNDPLPREVSSKLMAEYLDRHSISELLVVSSRHNKYANASRETFIEQLPVTFKQQELNFPLLDAEFIDGQNIPKVGLYLTFYKSNQYE